MEVSHVRNRLRIAMEGARERAQLRRQNAAAAEKGFETFLAIATPVVRQIANALKVEGYAFTVFTPERALRLASDRARDDFIEVTLDTSTDPPEVVARVSQARGSRTVDEERRLKPGSPPDAITEEEVLEFFALASRNLRRVLSGPNHLGSTRQEHQIIVFLILVLPRHRTGAAAGQAGPTRRAAERRSPAGSTPIPAVMLLEGELRPINLHGAGRAGQSVPSKVRQNDGT